MKKIGWRVYTNFDAAVPLPDSVTAALGGAGRYKGRVYVVADDKAEALEVLAPLGVLPFLHPRSLQIAPKTHEARIQGLGRAGMLRWRDDVNLVVTQDPQGHRLGRPPVLVLEQGRWVWEGRIRNGGRWQELTAEDTAHLGG